MGVAGGLRPLTGHERTILALMIASIGDGGAELTAQLEHVRVAGRWARGSVGITLQVPADLTRPSRLPDGPAPISAVVTGQAGEVLGELILWIEAGRLVGLGYAWVSDEPPQALPAVDQLTITPCQ